ncbi:MAG: hypothetical protein JNL57_09075 [Bacteroidetes bacterium]|nr:hypothetical protein [Bacteroidota bacterium]
MKKHNLLLSVIALLAAPVFANSAQPGYWNGTGYRNFHLLFAGDSAAMGKVRMESEFVYIRIYNGYAAVMGRYHMENLSKQALRFKAGYPLRTDDRTEVGGFVAKVHPDSLHVFHIAVDGVQQNVKLFKDTGRESYYPQTWYTWQAELGGSAKSVFEVFFLIPLEKSALKKGYGSHETWPFIYITESGATWQHPVGKGDICIELMDNLPWSCLEGVWPNSRILGNGKNRLYYHFENKVLSDTDNVILALQLNSPKNFQFSLLLADTIRLGNLESEMRSQQLGNWVTEKWQPTGLISALALKAETSAAWNLVWILPLIVAGAILGVIIWVIVKLARRLNRQPR